MRRYLAALLLLIAGTSWGAGPAPYPITIDSQSRVAPEIQVYRGSARTIRVAFKDGGSVLDGTGHTAFMTWSYSNTASVIYTSTVSWVRQAAGTADCAFAASQVNVAAGTYIYEVGVTDDPLVYRQGVFKVLASPYGAGAAQAFGGTNLNWASFVSQSGVYSYGPLRLGSGFTWTTNADGSLAVTATGSGDITGVYGAGRATGSFASGSATVTVSDASILAAAAPMTNTTLIRNAATGVTDSATFVGLSLSGHVLTLSDTVQSVTNGLISKTAAEDLTNGYIKVWVETDPIWCAVSGLYVRVAQVGTAAYSNSTAFASAGQGTLGATAYGWGDHGVVGYIKADGTVPMTARFDAGGYDVSNTPRVVFGSTGRPKLSYNESTRQFVVTTNAGADSYNVWHAGNDGAATGLDADLLDGQHGTYYATTNVFLAHTNDLLSAGAHGGETDPVWVAWKGSASLAAGDSASAGALSIAAGYAAAADDNAVAIGRLSAAAPSSVAVGDGATAGRIGVAVGTDCDAAGSSVSLGVDSIAATNSTAIGPFAFALGTNSVTIGNESYAVATNSMQVGKGTNTTANTLAVWSNVLIDRTGNTYHRGTNVESLLAGKASASLVASTNAAVTLALAQKGGLALNNTWTGTNGFTARVGLGTNAPTAQVHIHSPTNRVALQINSPTTWPASAIIAEIKSGTTSLLKLQTGGNLTVPGIIYNTASSGGLQTYSARIEINGTCDVFMRDLSSGDDDWYWRVTGDESYWVQSVGDSVATERVRFGSGGGLFLPPANGTNMVAAKTGYAGIFCASNTGDTVAELYATDSAANYNPLTPTIGTVKVSRVFLLNRHIPTARFVSRANDEKFMRDVCKKLSLSAADYITEIPNPFYTAWEKDEAAKVAESQAAIAAWTADTNAPAAKGDKPPLYKPQSKPARLVEMLQSEQVRAERALIAPSILERVSNASDAHPAATGTGGGVAGALAAMGAGALWRRRKGGK